MMKMEICCVSNKSYLQLLFKTKYNQMSAHFKMRVPSKTRIWMKTVYTWTKISNFTAINKILAWLKQRRQTRWICMNRMISMTSSRKLANKMMWGGRMVGWISMSPRCHRLMRDKAAIQRLSKTYISSILSKQCRRLNLSTTIYELWTLKSFSTLW